MGEQIIVFDLGNPEKGFTADRGAFKASVIQAFERGQEQTRGYISIYVLLFNQQGEIWIQERSPHIQVNGGRWCLSVAGHLTAGFTPCEIAALESVEEMGIPVIELGKRAFTPGYEKMKPYLGRVGLIKFLGTYLDSFPKIYQGVGTIPCVSKKELFIGVYHGVPEPLDGEVTNTKALSLPDLYAAIKNTPDQFTTDLIMVVDKYKSELEVFSAFLKAH